MLTSPVANAASFTWAHAVATDLPRALRTAFPPSGPSTGTATEPQSEQLALRGTGALTALRFPATGRWRHVQSTDVHWVWGGAADVLMHPGLATRLTLGNPLIALRFTETTDATADTGDKLGVERGAAIELGGVPVETSDLMVVACVPGAPGLDTLSVLRYASDALAGATFGTPTWQDFVGAMAGLAAPLRVLEPGGSPATGRQVSIVGGAGPVTLTAAHRGDALAALGITRAGLGTGLVLDVSAGGPVVASTSGTGHPDGRVPVMPTSSIVTTATVTDWFAAQRSPALTRFTRVNVVKPFVDGVDTYADLFRELDGALDARADGAFYVTGYSLHHDALLVPPTGFRHRTVAEYATEMGANGGKPRFLALQMIQPNPGVVPTMQTALALSAMVLALGGGVATAFQSDSSDQFSFFVHAEALAFALLLAPDLQDLLDGLDLNRDAIEELAAIPGVEAFLDPVDADVGDNPHAVTVGTIAELALALQRRFNVFHQKIQVVGNSDGIHAYCGGIDLNSNRTQTPAHASRSPFHDVHARINGPAALELTTTFIERWNEPGGRDTLALDGAVSLGALPPTLSDVVQVGRTYYGPAAGAGHSLGFAENGERTILDTLLSAIGQARRYIYIEDQYLTPPPEYTAGLIDAARCVSGPLIIAVPAVADQPFGLPHRQELVADLRAAWGDRVRVGVLRKRFSHADTNRESSSGRLWLTEDVTALADTIKLSPAERVPSTPFWLTVGSEVMRAYGAVAGVSDPASVSVRVERGDATRLFGAASGTGAKEHKARSAVLCGRFPDIYVHSKMMLVDDAFAAIGSANLNRRGFFSDGECDIFALREQVADGDNWIRNLRIALWAEHLGLTPEYAAAALRDPAAALPLFDRRFTVGCRFTPFEATPYATMATVAAEFNDRTGKVGGVAVVAQFMASMGAVMLGAEADNIFATFIDPSSEVETT